MSSDSRKMGKSYMSTFIAAIQPQKVLEFMGMCEASPVIDLFEIFWKMMVYKPMGEEELVQKYLEDMKLTRLTAQEFLEWTCTKDLQSELETIKPDGVTLITCHAAKGLEWDTVIVYGLSKNCFPGGRTKDLEEERRLAYVAMTRARKNLHLFFLKQPSMFLHEAGVVDSIQKPQINEGVAF